MKNIIFLGETKDFSDQWLIDILSKYYTITLLDIAKAKVLNIPKDSQLLINRIYASSIQRFGKKKILNFVRIIRRMEHERINVINSSRGYELETSRKKQAEFFRKKSFPFIKTLDIKQALSNKNIVAPPYVLKYNVSGRNKKLRVIRNAEDLLSISNSSKINSIIQPLINKSTCFRTEFVGKWNSTFTQHIDTKKDYLKFNYTHRIIPTPLSKPFVRRICNRLNKIGVQVFSIEYFMEKKGLLAIVDFNLTSNYPYFFVKKSGSKLKKAWLNLIKNATI